MNNRESETLSLEYVNKLNVPLLVQGFERMLNGQFPK